MTRLRPSSPAGFSVFLSWLRHDKRSALAVGYLTLAVLVAVFAPVVARQSPNAQDLTAILKGPSAAHWLGTDDLGRDVWARLVYGTRSSLLASVLAVGVALVIGVPVGLLSGFLGSWTDALLMRVVDTLLAFPAIVLAIGIVAAIGPGLVTSMVGVGIVFSPSIARVTRAQVLEAKVHLYIDAATTFGSPARKTILRHILRNVAQPIIVQATFLLGLALLAEASLSFLGLGVQAPESSWGVMLQTASQFADIDPGQVYPAGIAIALTVLAFNALGDGLRDLLDPVARTQWQARGGSAATAATPTLVEFGLGAVGSPADQGPGRPADEGPGREVP
jgi:peptide/nickel transport system permease protein